MCRRAWTTCSLGLVLALSALADDSTTTGSAGIDARFENESLQEAVAILGMLTGTAVEIEGDVSDQRISTVLRDATLEEGLHQVLREMSYVIIRRTDGGVTVLALGPAGRRAASAGEQLPGQPGVSPSPVPGMPNLTATDIASDQSSVQQFDRDTIEVVPPTGAGGRGVTWAEFDAMMANRRELAPSELEVLPSSEPGGKGLTLAALEELLERERPERSLADEVPRE